MATPAIMAKKAAKQTAQILETVTNLVAAVGSMADELVNLKAEIAELKAAEPDTIELKAEIDETADRAGEILAAIGNAFGETREQVDRNLSACAMIAAEVAELKALIEPARKMPPQMPSRKPKK